MKKLTNLSYEELPFSQQSKVLGSGDGSSCKCSDYCSCYTTGEKQGHIDNATDTAEDVDPQS